MVPTAPRAMLARTYRCTIPCLWQPSCPCCRRCASGSRCPPETGRSGRCRSRRCRGWWTATMRQRPWWKGTALFWAVGGGKGACAGVEEQAHTWSARGQHVLFSVSRT